MGLASLLCVVLLAGTGVSSDESEFLQLEKAWNKAHVRGDAAVLESLWADDLVVTVPKMPVIMRDDAIAMARSGRIKFAKYETSGLRVRVYGDSALVTGSLERTRERDGRLAEDHWQFTKVYRRQKGKWRVIAFHASEAPEK